MGPLPGRKKRCALDLRVEQETDGGSYVRRLITYASEPGSRVPAYLLIPKAALDPKKKLPAILALHPTDMQSGHLVVTEELRANTAPTAATWPSAATWCSLPPIRSWPITSPTSERSVTRAAP